MKPSVRITAASPQAPGLIKFIKSTDGPKSLAHSSLEFRETRCKFRKGINVHMTKAEHMYSLLYIYCIYTDTYMI